MRGVEPTTHCRIYEGDRDRLMLLTACKNGYRRERGEKRWNSADAIRGLLDANVALRGRIADQRTYYEAVIAGLRRKIGTKTQGVNSLQ